MVYDFHTHTYLSDGVLSPVELIRRAVVNGYSAIAVTDHAGLWDQDRILEILVKECEVATEEMGIIAIPGVELTHVPPNRLGEAAKRAKSLGAKIVIVHGETIKEPVALGTNKAALLSPDVDVLAHPGLLDEEEAILAAERGTFLELTSRAGHSLTNGFVVQVAAATGARLILNSDTHEPEDLLTDALARTIVMGSGVLTKDIETVLASNPQSLLGRLGLNY